MPRPRVASPACPQLGALALLALAACGGGDKAASPATAPPPTVMILGVRGKAPTDPVRGSVTVQVAASDAGGSVVVSASGHTFAAAAGGGPGFDVELATTLLPDGPVQLTATLTGGGGSATSVAFTLHVDNTPPALAPPAVAPATASEGAVVRVDVTSDEPLATISGDVKRGATVVGRLAEVSAPTPSGAGEVRHLAFAVEAGLGAGTFELAVAASDLAGNAAGAPPASFTVVAPPSFTGTFSVTPSAITTGDAGNVTFTAPTFGASVATAEIRDGSGTPVVAALTSGGTARIAMPASTTTYTLVLGNGATPALTASTSATVTVHPPATIASFVAGASTLTAGASTTLTPVFAGGQGVVIPGSLPVQSGVPLVVAPSATATYRLAVTNPAGVEVTTGTGGATDVVVTVVAAPVISTFTPQAPVVTNFGTTTLTYALSGGDCATAGRCRISGPAGYVLDVPAANADGLAHATPPLTPPQDATSVYTLTVTNAAGTSSSATAGIVAVRPPSAALTPTQAILAKGGALNLTASLVGSVAYVLNDTGTRVAGNLAGPTATVSVSPTRTTRYTLVVENAAGAVATSTADVQVLNTITWTPGSLPSGYGSTATLLRNGQVLVAGGAPAPTGSAPTRNAYIYDPITGSFTLTGSMVKARRDHTAHLLSDGRVLLVGGSDAVGAPLSSLEAFTPGAAPVLGTFATVPLGFGAMAYPRTLHASVALADGRILVTGGCGTDVCNATAPDARQTAEIIDVVAGTTSSLPMNAPHVSHTATALADGRVLVAGGATTSGVTTAGQAFAEVYSPAAGTFACTGTNCLAGRTTMASARVGHGAVLLDDGRVALIGGRDGSGAALASIETFDPGAGTFAASAASLSVPRSELRALRLGGAGRLLVTGGWAGPLTASTALDLFDVSGSTLTPVTPVDALQTARAAHTSTVLFGGSALIVGGSFAPAGEVFSSYR